MSRKEHDAIEAFARLTDTAEAFVNRSPRVKRIQEQRAALLDAIGTAQLVLSVHRLPKERESSAKAHKHEAKHEKELQTMRAKVQHLTKRLRPLAAELEGIQMRAENVKRALEGALAEQETQQDEAA